MKQHRVVISLRISELTGILVATEYYIRIRWIGGKVTNRLRIETVKAVRRTVTELSTNIDQRTNYGQSTQDFTYSTYCVPIHGFLP